MTYEDGLTNGRLDFGLGIRLTTAWLSDTEYGRGYREAWAQAEGAAFDKRLAQMHQNNMN